MTTRVWLVSVLVLFALSNIMTYPGYDRVIWGTPVWLWVDMLIVFAIGACNWAFARRLNREEESS